MRTAIIDLGTNSVRFDVYQFNPTGKIDRLHREKIMVRLGEGLFLKGKLSQEATQRTLHTLLKFKEVAQKLHVHRILAFGTSALRDAKDSDSFLKLVFQKCSIQLRIISGIEEAKLIALGILSNEPLKLKRFALVDIGGGSTEISLCQSKKIAYSSSFQLGTARLQQVFLKQSPPSAEKLLQLREFIRNTLILKMEEEHWPKVDLIVGSSGTVRALSKIFKKIYHTPLIERGRLHKLNEKMQTLTPDELLLIPGMEPKRTDMIIAGSILLEESMHALGAKQVRATEYSLRDGILEEERQLFTQGKKYHLSLHLEDLYRQAMHFGKKEKHLRSIVLLADTLFVNLKPIHKLDDEWKAYLAGATLLCKVGEVISIARHSEQSYYIIKNCDLPPMEEWEVDLIAGLCLYHEGHRHPNILLIPFSHRKVKRPIFLKLLSLLRLVNALDTRSETSPRIRSISIEKTGKKRGIELSVAKRTLTGLETINLETEKDLFEQLFKRKLTLKAV